ncbi:hypothetical protein [Kitasatospora purpeofusca]|uniref:hypothetical protein n=1 Tax=Kitasatospora purpeofusca TaxID=67352 RepID=UPI0036D32EC1
MHGEPDGRPERSGEVPRALRYPWSVLPGVLLMVVGQVLTAAGHPMAAIAVVATGAAVLLPVVGVLLWRRRRSGPAGTGGSAGRRE